jgi:serine/threonine-protein kinase
VSDDAHSQLLAGRYRQLGTIGSGGMARVFLAEDERLGRKVAIKRLHADSPAEAAARFEREARLGASLNHPNLVSVYDIDTESEAVLIVMELVEGETLREEIARGPLAIGTVTRVARNIASALDHAHGQGVVHRDVKPANILIREDGVAKLADLGIATAAAYTQITSVGTVLGTPAYMAPEQLDGGRIGPATDIYAFATVLYEALSGQRAVQGATPVEIAHQIEAGTPPDLTDIWPDAPHGAADALAWGMERDPGNRPRSACELAVALERGLAEADTRSMRTGIAAGGAAAGLAAAGAGAAYAGEPARDPAPTRVSDLPPEPPRHDTGSRPPTYSGGRRGVPWKPIAAVAAVLLVGLIAIGFGALPGGGEDPADRAASSSGGQAQPDPATATPEQTEESAPAPAPEEAVPEPEPATPAEEPAPTGDPVALNDQGYALIQEGRYEEAVPLLEQSVAGFGEGSTDMSYAFALFNLGTALHRSGRSDEAVPFLEQRLAVSDFKTDVVEAELAAARGESE